MPGFPSRGRASVLLALLALAAPIAHAPGARLSAQGAAPDPALLARANRILARVPVIDGHNDLPSELLEKFGGDPWAAHLDTGQPSLQTDLPRLRAGHVGAQFWSAYVENDSIATHAALRQAIREIDMARRLADAYPGALAPALTAADIERIERSGRTASLIGVEGGHGIENSLSALRAFYDLGVRYMTLTHNTTLDWADAALDVPKHHGLTPFGQAVVREMNRLGMFVDLAHVSAEVMRDALRVSQAPVIFSHSSARALIDSPRNVPDDVLEMLKKNGGVVMVNFCPCFTARGYPEWEARMRGEVAAARAQGGAPAEAQARVRAWEQQNPRPKATVSDIADHIDHLVKLAGIDHVGIGSDYDGTGGDLPVGLPDVSSYPVLFAELLRRGYAEGDLEKIAGRNLLRAMKDMEQVSARLRRSLRPGLEDIAPGAAVH
ncbi:MAG TPA: dipeptidase [Longimicrobiales bacterium]